MSPSYDTASNPLTERYASSEMSYIFSAKFKFSQWRRLWYELAKAEMELGLKEVTKEQVEKLKEHVQITDKEIELAATYEKKFRHDVMSHVHALGDTVGEDAKKIIHLGATSCYVGDNTDLIVMKEGLGIIEKRLVKVMDLLQKFCFEHRNLACLGYTHYQVAQFTTVGKRACLWLQDLLLDLEEIVRVKDGLKFRGVKGTTGTQASFMKLFGDDHEKVKQLDEKVTKAFGFEKVLTITGQTYTRKQDSIVLNALSLISQSITKMCVDIRLLSNLRELEEPFGKSQIGSSAMAYKRNPMRCERATSLARFVMNLSSNAHHTHANQWMERTLDDSANRRISISQAFLATDAVLIVASNVIDGLQVFPTVINEHCLQELPFMITENIIMECVQKGGDRQELHEIIREHSMEAIKTVKIEGLKNDLVKRLKDDKRLSAVHESIDTMMNPNNFVGRAPQQVEEFLTEVNTILGSYSISTDKDELQL